MHSKSAVYLPKDKIIVLGRTLLLSGSMFVLSMIAGKIGLKFTSLFLWTAHPEMLFNIYQSGILAILLIVWMITAEDKDLKEIGFCYLPLKMVLISLAVGIVIFAVLLYGADLCGKLWPDKLQTQALIVQAEKAVSFAEIGNIYFLSVFIAPLSEEIMFRGFIYQHLREKLGLISAIIVTSFLFGLLHFDLYRLGLLFLAGVVLNILREISGSLYASLIAHSVWNACMLSIVFLF